MSRPVISLFSSAIRPWLWPRLLESLQSSRAPFEIVFVGNQVPTLALPSNVHFLYSATKPAQCFEIAARYTTGEFLLNVGDDAVFSPGYLDVLLAQHQRLRQDLDIASGRYRRNDIFYEDSMHRFFPETPGSPVLPVCSFMHRSLWDRLGGIDSQFVALCWDIDMAMRALELGGRVSLCNEAVMTEVTLDGRDDQSGLYLEVGCPIDRAYLESTWVLDLKAGEPIPTELHCIHQGDRALLLHRKHPSIPFHGYHLLTRSQAPTGRWV